MSFLKFNNYNHERYCNYKVLNSQLISILLKLKSDYSILLKSSDFERFLQKKPKKKQKMKLSSVFTLDSFYASWYAKTRNTYKDLVLATVAPGTLLFDGVGCA